MTAMPTIAAPSAPGAPYPIVIVGHVDHGKSTLTGRLLHDTGSISPARVEAARAASQRRGKTMEWAFLLDGFQAERDRAITIDTARIRFRSLVREYTIIDAPGHKEFIKNMITGAASAQGAVLVIDVAEGLAEQTTRHAHLLQLLGIAHVIVAINKMDSVGYEQAAFEKVAADISDYLTGLGITPTHLVPIAARAGVNIVAAGGAGEAGAAGAAGSAMPWYDGPTLIEALDALPATTARADQPLRLPIQDVYDFGGSQSIIGRVESGRLRIGDDLIIQPSSRAARVTGLAGWRGDPGEGAPAGQSVAITLDQRQPVQRGEVVATSAAAPSPVRSLRASIFWFGEQPLRLGASYTLKAHTARYPVTVTAIEAVVDSNTLASTTQKTIPQAGIGRVLLESTEPMVLETFADNPRLGRFVLLSGFETVGGGTVSDVAVAPSGTVNIFPTASQVATRDRAAVFGHRGAVLWLTGLSGAGKSTIAYAVERHLLEQGLHAYVLDGDNIRRGLSAGLGFSAPERSEHLRRVAAAAGLFADAGIIVLVAAISPSHQDRDRARAASPGHFHEIFVDAPLAVCEARDPKQLYQRARRGEITNFTGISAPFEPPQTPDLHLKTDAQDLDACVDALAAYVQRQVSPPNAA